MTFQIMEAKWGRHASVKWVIIGSDNGMLPIQHQAITLTSADLLLYRSLQIIHFNETLLKEYRYFYSKKHLKCCCQNFC